MRTQSSIVPLASLLIVALGAPLHAQPAAPTTPAPTKAATPVTPTPAPAQPTPPAPPAAAPIAPVDAEAPPAADESVDPEAIAEVGAEAEAGGAIEPAPVQDVDRDSVETISARDAYRLAIAPRIGLTVPTSKLGLMAAGGLQIDYRLPFLSGLFVAVDFAFTRPAHDGTAMDPRVPAGAEFELDEAEYKFALDAVYRHSLNDSLVLVGGLGPVIQILRTSETTSLAPGSNAATKTYFGFEALGGADYRIGPGFLLGELRAVYSNLNDLLTGDSNGGNVQLSIGYRITL